MSHEYKEFQDTLDNDDYGIIIGKDGTIKGIWIPKQLENEQQIPDTIANFCKKNFEVDPNDETCYHTIH